MASSSPLRDQMCIRDSAFAVKVNFLVVKLSIVKMRLLNGVGYNIEQRVARLAQKHLIGKGQQIDLSLIHISTAGFH